MTQSAAQDLIAVKAMLEEFRQTSAPRARVPPEIRAAVLELIDRGTPVSKVCKATGLAHGQFQMWRKSAGLQKPTIITASRVLTVEPSHTAEADLPKGLRVSYEGGRLVVELSL